MTKTASERSRSCIGVRDRAVLLLRYAAALRPGDIAALHLADVSLGRHGLLVTIRRSKTDQEALGQVFGLAAGVHAATDPIRALRVWPDLRPAGPGPLFTRLPATRPITSEGIGRRTVSDLGRNRATAAGLGDLGLSGRSLRAGHATPAAVKGATIDRIAAQTRHRDLTTLFNHYIRSRRRARDHHQPRTWDSEGPAPGQSRSDAPGHWSARRGVLLVPTDCTLRR